MNNIVVVYYIQEMEFVSILGDNLTYYTSSNTLMVQLD